MDSYPELKKSDYLQNLDKTSFIEFFFQFARDGGKIQSGGARTAGLFKKTFESNFEKFKAFVLEPYKSGFNVDVWLERLSEFDYFGGGLATIFLNRIDKNRFVIVNS